MHVLSREQQQLNGRLAKHQLYYIVTHDTTPAKHNSRQINLAIVCDTSFLLIQNVAAFEEKQEKRNKMKKKPAVVDVPLKR